MPREKALSISPRLGVPYFALALNHQFNWRWRQSRADFERAVELRPNDPHLLTWYAALELFSDGFDDALRLARKAVALDPANTWAGLILGSTLHAAGDYPAAVAAYRDFSAMHPESSLPYLHRVLPEIALGHSEEALEQLRLADQLMPDEAAPAIHLHLGSRRSRRRARGADRGRRAARLPSGGFRPRLRQAQRMVRPGTRRARFRCASRRPASQGVSPAS